MFNLPEKYTEIDGFRIPSDKAEEYKRIKARMIREAETFFHTFCEEVKKEKLVDLLGEGIVGYSSTGEMLARISLDPFELSAMNVALQRKRLENTCWLRMATMMMIISSFLRSSRKEEQRRRPKR